jgi:spore maturation protein SpmA/spore maturation protein SpmB
MLNYIWLGLIALAVVMGGFHGNIGDVGNAAVDSAKDAVILVGGLLGVMTMWLGLMRLADKAGLVKRLGLILKPILVWLFPEVPANHPAMGSIVLNVAANILGLNSAATPLGLRAMNELESLNKSPGVATNAMCMLLAINTSSITLIPVSVLALLSLHHGKNPTVIIGTSLAATAVAHLCAIATCKLLERTSWSKRQLLEKVDSPQAREAHSAATEGGEIARKAGEADTALPWAPGAQWILSAFSGIFIGLVLGLAFPELTKILAGAFDQIFHLDAWMAGATQPVPPETLARFWLLRIVDALSLLVLPWLILLFPLYATLRRIPVYDEFVEGGKEGFQVVLRILPYVVGMLVAVGMFKAAGGLQVITAVLSPVTNLFHFPAELLPIAVIRPFSYAAALALLTDLVKSPAYGPDNIITLMAATFYGCSETTFYVIAVYFGSVGVRKTRHAIPAGIVADIIGPIAAVVICRAVLS